MELSKFSKNNLLQRLKNNYIDDVEYPLAPADEEKKRLLDKIWSLREGNKYHQNEIIKILMRPVIRGGEGLSRTTAYNNYKMAMQIYGELDSVEIAAEKAIARAVFHDIYLKALKNGDLKNANKAYENYMKHIPEDMSDRIDPEMLKASVFRQVLPKEVKNYFKKSAEKGVIDLMFLNAEDAEWSEKSEEDEDDE